MNRASFYSLLLLCFLLLCHTSPRGQTFQYYFGNLHAHTAYSDGNKDKAATGVKTPAGSYAFAKHSDHLNFLGISEHNHGQAGMKLLSYNKGLQEAGLANKNGSFVCMYGMEYGVISNGGHVLIYGVDQLIGWEANNFDVECAKSDYTALWDLLADYPDAFVTLAHPENTDFHDLLNGPYNQTADKVICGVAIMTGPAFAKNTDYKSKPAKKFTGYFQGLLAAGYHVGPTVDHDNHYLTFGRMASSRTVVLAGKLDHDSIMGAYRNMRFYASTDWNAQVQFTVNGFPMGSRINTKTKATIKVEVTDPDAGDNIQLIQLMYGQPGSKQLSTPLSAVSNTNTLNFSHNAAKGKLYYYYLEITQNDGDKIYTSPVWVHRL